MKVWSDTDLGVILQERVTATSDQENNKIKVVFQNFSLFWIHKYWICVETSHTHFKEILTKSPTNKSPTNLNLYVFRLWELCFVL